MKRLIFSFYLVTIFSISSCCTTNPFYSGQPDLLKLTEFNEASGFHTGFVKDCEILKEAAHTQGNYKYPGVDDWFAVELSAGCEVLCVIPGQSWFYTIEETYLLSKATKGEFFKLIQLKDSKEQDSIGFFHVKRPVHAAVSKALNNLCLMVREELGSFLFLIIIVL